MSMTPFHLAGDSTRTATAFRVVRAGLIAGLLAVAAATAAWAAPIAVANPSFEALPPGGLDNACGGGCSFSQDTIPGWINTPFSGLGLNSGQFRPGTDIGNTTYFNTLSDGPTSAYTSNGCIVQTVSSLVQAGTTYTLLVDVGWRNDAGPTAFPRLLVNGFYYDPTGAPVQGGWATYTTTYVARPEDVGQPITICLGSVSFQGNFDNVRLSDSTTPLDAPSGPRRNLELAAWPSLLSARTRLRFALPHAVSGSLRAYDASGRLVRTLALGERWAAGSHEVIWDGGDDSGRRADPGVYFIRLDAGERQGSVRVFLVR